MMSITLGEGIVATGEPQELAVFYACLLGNLKVIGDVVKREEDKNKLISKVLSQLQSIEIRKDDDQDQGDI